MITQERNLIVELQPPLAYLTLNRPEKRNALSLEFMQEMTAAMREIGANREIGVVILKANGPVFSAGHDLSEMVDRDVAFYRRLFEACTEMMEAIQSIPQPVIAQVHALATAAGCQLVATCDLVVASEEAKFATPGVKVGLFCSTPVVAVSRNVHAKKALEMALTGEPISAHDALAAGLVNKVVPTGELEAATHTLAQKILASSPLVVGIGKQAFYRQIEMPQAAAYDYTEEVMSLNLTAADAQEGICAFLDKRKPAWKNR